jgi:hypothetical protein
MPATWTATELSVVGPPDSSKPGANAKPTCPPSAERRRINIAAVRGTLLRYAPLNASPARDRDSASPQPTDTREGLVRLTLRVPSGLLESRYDEFYPRFLACLAIVSTYPMRLVMSISDCTQLRLLNCFLETAWTLACRE